MKKKNFFKILVAGFFLFLFSAMSFAQDHVTIVNASHTYGPTTASGGVFTYEVYTNVGLTTIADHDGSGGDDVLSISTSGDNATIQWLASGTYYVVMTETNVECSTENVWQVDVVGAEIEIAAVNSAICSSDGSTTYTVRLENEGTDDLYTGSDLGTLTVTYTTSGMDSAAPASPASWDSNSSKTFTITATISSNTGTGSTPAVITLTSVKTASDASLTLASSSASTTVYDVPGSNDIELK